MHLYTIMCCVFSTGGISSTVFNIADATGAIHQRSGTSAKVLSWRIFFFALSRSAAKMIWRRYRSRSSVT